MTWKDNLHPQHSKMEIALMLRFASANVKFETDKPFCLQSTTPDFYFPDQNLAVYIDGMVHCGREEKDELLRELLTKRYGIRVLSISYVKFNIKERERIFKEIMCSVKASSLTALKNSIHKLSCAFTFSEQP